MKNLLLVATFLFSAFMVNAQDLPPNPEPGKCYVKCVTPDEFKDEEIRVEVMPSYRKITVKKAGYGKDLTKTIVVKEACTTYECTPAVYKKVTERISTGGGYDKINVKLASFKDEKKEFEVYPKIGRWEYTAYEGCESDNPADCQVLCWREYPAQTTEVNIKTLANNAEISRNRVEVDNFVEVTKEVLVKPAECKAIEVPAVTKTITYREYESEDTVVTIVPAQFTTITKTVLVKKGGVTSWESIDCELLEYNVLPINYEYGSARLTAQARKIIDDRLLTLMNAKSNVRMEISAHTDARGNNASNLSLSEQRAQSVVSYLVSKGINKSRLVSKGYGESRLKNRCADGVNCTEAEHAANRRTEFRILNN
ncbi:MAG: hypothetical protein DHS20C18_09540 [Saprospiraceae bacterium]|nr:MAG: hypothetical protein DHS20C18_09540 [Saprospiraceae bacterium]